MCYLKMKVSPFNDMSWAGPARGHSRQQWPPQAGPRDSGRSPLCDRTQIQRPLHTEGSCAGKFQVLSPTRYVSPCPGGVPGSPGGTEPPVLEGHLPSHPLCQHQTGRKLRRDQQEWTRGSRFVSSENSRDSLPENKQTNTHKDNINLGMEVSVGLEWERRSPRSARALGTQVPLFCDLSREFTRPAGLIPAWLLYPPGACRDSRLPALAGVQANAAS